MYLAQMEALNIPYTLEMFISSPKEGMIKGLWKNHSNEPQVDIANRIETRDAQYFKIKWISQCGLVIINLPRLRFK